MSNTGPDMAEPPPVWPPSPPATFSSCSPPASADGGEPPAHGEVVGRDSVAVNLAGAGYLGIAVAPHLTSGALAATPVDVPGVGA